jgi:translocation and assembly module TamB
MSGTVALGDSAASDLKYRVEAINLPELARLAGQEGIGGTATVEGRVTGNRAALTTTGTLNGSNLSYNENNALDLNSKYTVTVPDLEFKRARVEATTEADFVKAGGLQINQVTATTTYEGQTIAFTTHIQEETRELDARGEVILHPDHQEVHLPELAVRTQGVEWRTKPGTEAAIRYGRNRIELENVQLVSADQSLGVEGTIALGGEAPAGALDVSAQNVDLQQLETLLLQDRGFTGKLSANARLTGTTEAPVVDGHVEIHNGGVQTYRYESLIADVDYEGERFSVDATLTQTPAERITVTGSAPLSLLRRSEREGHVPPAGAEAVDLRIQSTALGLGFVQGFTDQIANVSGTLEADVRITGSGDDPHLEGHVDIRNGAFGVPAGGVSYTGLNTRIDLTPDRASIQSFSIVDEEGATLNVSGSLAVHERSVGAVNIALNSDNFEIIDNELGDVGVKTAITITGELRRPKVEGRIEIETGRIEVDRLLTLFYDPYATQSLPDVVSAEQQVQGAGSAEEATRQALMRAQKGAAPPAAAGTTGTEPAPPQSLFDAVELDLTLVIPQNLVLRGNDIRPGGPTRAAVGDINITIGGDLEINKAPGDQVRLVGTVETVRGTYEFQGRRFELVRGGELRFVGETEINPFLDVTATRMIPNTGVEARIHITGTLKTPELELSSTPPLEESDILALIVFNRPVNELGTGERSSLAATAGGIATGFIAAPLGESIGRALDLDLFEITTTNDNGELGAGITVGQQIGDRAFLRLRQQFGEQNTTEFLVEYQLARFLRLQMSAAPETSGSANRINQQRVEKAGLDLIFFFSY